MKSRSHFTEMSSEEQRGSTDEYSISTSSETGLNRVEEVHSQFHALKSKRDEITQEYKKAKTLLEQQYKAKLAETQAEYDRLQKTSRRLDLLEYVKESSEPVGVIAWGIFDSALEVEDEALFESESYGQLVIHAQSIRSVCDDDRCGDSFDCDWEIDWSRTKVRIPVEMQRNKPILFEESDSKWKLIPLSECKFDTSFIVEELELERSKYPKQVKYTDIKGDHHGLYALGEIVKDIVLLTWIP